MTTEASSQSSSDSADTLRLCGQKIVLLASAPYESFGPLNCHHLAKRLSQDNEVLFIESPGLRKPKLRQSSDLKRSIKRLSNWLASRGKSPPLVEENLFRLSPLLLPGATQAWTRSLNRRLLQSTVRQAMQKLQWKDAILWSFLPSAIDLVDMPEFTTKIYHCVDDYSSNPGVASKLIQQQEKSLLEKSDLCITTSEPLAEKLSAYLSSDSEGLAPEHGSPSKIHCLPNVAEINSFLDCKSTAAELKEFAGPIIGYIGNIAAYKVDIDLLSKLAKAHSNWQLVLVGPLGQGDPSTQVNQLLALDNVHHFPSCPYEDVPKWIHALDVCLIPFQLSKVTHSSFPLKTLEYLASGKPVVSSPLRSLKQNAASEFISFAEGAEEFGQAIEASFKPPSPEQQARRLEYCLENSWTKRYFQISSLVTDHL